MWSGVGMAEEQEEGLWPGVVLVEEQEEGF